MSTPSSWPGADPTPCGRSSPSAVPWSVGATRRQMFWRITVPLVMPFIVVAAIIRIIDALKAFEVIYVIIEGGPGRASATW